MLSLVIIVLAGGVIVSLVLSLWALLMAGARANDLDIEYLDARLRLLEDAREPRPMQKESA